ncbi:TetR/AcrR family transcriptional regulator [Burkholderia sp. F1]|uniref:TetR/AcrR family transcriptional regulator n=1 Tax=Burkholderia sp. F1 TaxID=3366817 RepID=UPI003D71AA47
MQRTAIKQETSDYSEEAEPNTRVTARRNRELRIREILDVARQVFQEDGYAGFATRRVADRVGITLGNLQYYFRTKEELLRAALLAFMCQTIENYAAIASQSNISAIRRCSTLVERIFQDISQTDLPKFLVEVWAFAQHEPYATELVDDMCAKYRSVFARLVSDLHPNMPSKECLARASVIVAKFDGMVLLTSRGEYPEKDYTEFVRVTKRAVKMIVGMSGQPQDSENSLQGSHTPHVGDTNDAHVGLFGSDRDNHSEHLDLRNLQATQASLYYRPTIQGKRREIKVNEILSTAVNLLATEGYANFTLVRVAKELGILTSALRNYFPTHDDLLRSTIGALGKIYLDRYTDMGKPSAKSALDRLCEIAEDVFEAARDPKECRLWFEMYALAQHSDVARELVRNVYIIYRGICADLVREIDSTASARECLARATLITAQADGAGILMFGASEQSLDVDRVFELMMTMTIRIAHGKIATNDAVQ